MIPEEAPGEAERCKTYIRVRKAASLAPKTYPGPVGDYLRRELTAWDDYGYRFGAHSLIHGIVDQIIEQSEALDAA